MNDVDPERLGQLLQRVEVDLHRSGWDQPAAMYVLYDGRHQATDGVFRAMMRPQQGRSAVRWQYYTARPAIPPGMLDGQPAHAPLNVAREDRPGLRSRPSSSLYCVWTRVMIVGYKSGTNEGRYPPSGTVKGGQEKRRSTAMSGSLRRSPDRRNVS
jgi:hypothetical protein